MQGEEIEVTRKRGEVVKEVKQYSWQEIKGKSIVIVWDGKKKVPVTIPTQYMRKVFANKIFPYKITTDPKTGQYVSQGRPIF